MGRIDPEIPLHPFIFLAVICFTKRREQEQRLPWMTTHIGSAGPWGEVA